MNPVTLELHQVVGGKKGILPLIVYANDPVIEHSVTEFSVFSYSEYPPLFTMARAFK